MVKAEVLFKNNIFCLPLLIIFIFQIIASASVAGLGTWLAQHLPASVGAAVGEILFANQRAIDNVTFGPNGIYVAQALYNLCGQFGWTLVQEITRNPDAKLFAVKVRHKLPASTKKHLFSLLLAIRIICFMYFQITITQTGGLIRPLCRRVISTPLPCFSVGGPAHRTPEPGMAGGMAIGALDFAALSAFGVLGFINEEFITENSWLRGVIGFTARMDPLKQQAMLKHIAQF